MDLKKRRGPDLLRAAIWTTSELFGHIISSALDCTHTHGLYSDRSAPKSVFGHLCSTCEKMKITLSNYFPVKEVSFSCDILRTA